MQQPTARQWLEANWNNYATREDRIQACMDALGCGRRNAASKHRSVEAGGSASARQPKAVQTIRPATTGSASMNAGGMTREQARMRHDTPARLIASLDSFLASLSPDNLREENEVMRICKVAHPEMAYWQEITAQRQYASYQGYTEKGVRLWGHPEDIEWANGPDGITGFRLEA